jgi:hypothetical protein
MTIEGYFTEDIPYNIYDCNTRPGAVPGERHHDMRLHAATRCARLAARPIRLMLRPASAMRAVRAWRQRDQPQDVRLHQRHPG